MKDGSPLVSIGVPLFNSEATLNATLESLLDQTHLNLEIIISDNLSTDRTLEICMEFQKRDNRIVLYPQNVNIGATQNFSFVLQHSKGDYFMWNAGDDIRSKDFIEVNLNYLLSDHSSVASTSPNIHDNENFASGNFVTHSLEGNLRERFNQFFELPGASHGFFYSLMCSEEIKSCPYVAGKNFWGWDWAIILYLATQGNIHRAVGGYTILGSQGISRRSDPLLASGVRGIGRLFPFTEFTKIIMLQTKDLCFSDRFVVAYLLFSLNLKTLLKSNRISLYFFFNMKKLLASLKKSIKKLLKV